MIKNIKFLDVDYKGRNYSFQIHLHDYVDLDSFNVRVFFAVADEIGHFFKLLKNMLENNQHLFKAYCATLTRDCCSRIAFDYYSDEDERTFEVGFRSTGILFEKADYTSMLPANSNDHTWTYRMRNQEHINVIAENMYTLDLSNKLEVDYAIMRTAEVLNTSGLISGMALDFHGFILSTFMEVGYEIRDVRGAELVYEDNYTTININDETDDIRYLYALMYMMYATFTRGGILVIDHCELFDHGTLLFLINMYKTGLPDRAKAQLIICSPDEDLYAMDKYKARIQSTDMCNENPFTNINKPDVWHRYL